MPNVVIPRCESNPAPSTTSVENLSRWRLERHQRRSNRHKSPAFAESGHPLERFSNRPTFQRLSRTDNAVESARSPPNRTKDQVAIPALRDKIAAYAGSF